MIVILIGSKSGKGNGKKIIADSTEAVLAAFEQLEHFKVIKIQAGSSWLCEQCDRINVTKFDREHCGFCGRRGRKFNASGEIVYKNKTENMEKLIETVFKDRGVI
jgi:hypothetical protein